MSKKCTLAYAHAPVWCDACWEDAQRVREVSIQAAHLAELKRANDLKEWELETAGSPRPRPVYYPPPQPADKPSKPQQERRGL